VDLLTPIVIGLWAWLWAYVLRQPGEIFASFDALAQRILHPEREGWRLAIYKPLIGCPKCHAGQVALWWQIYDLCTVHTFSLPFIIIAVAVAAILEKWLK
jgi:hypothetical protein